MSNFFEKFKADANKKDANDDKKKKNKPFQNPLARVGKAVGGRKFGGEGQSLGGSRPGRVILVSLEQPGPLGVKIEKRPNSQGTAIVSLVVPESQAEAAGLQRGDILCHAGSDGEEEIMYDQFIAMAASDNRPLIFEVRRIQAKSSSNTASSTTTTTAESYSRKQAVIAAAEAREKAHKKLTKPMGKKDSGALQPKKPLPLPTQQGSTEPMSEAAKQAIEAAKKDESAHAAQLGYNPYEAAKANAGQARTASTASKHGTIAKSDSAQDEAPPKVATPVDPAIPVSEEFEDALMTMVTTNEDAAVKASLSVMRKLIINATTKGQATDDEAAASKFRKVRLSNAKIKTAVAETIGALDVMMSVGFQLAEEDGESYLVYPPGDKGPEWLLYALEQMEKIEKSSEA